MHHPGFSTLGYASLLVAQDAYHGWFRLTPAQAVEVIINQQRGWCIDEVGWTWITVKQYSDAEVLKAKREKPNWNHDAPGWYLEFDLSLGPASVWGGRSNPKRRRYYRFNWAQYRLEDPYPGSAPVDVFIGEDLDDHGFDYKSNRGDDSIFERIACMGLLPGQKILVRGKGWSHKDYFGEYSDGYDTEIVYISPATIDDNEFADIISKDQCIV